MTETGDRRRSIGLLIYTGTLLGLSFPLGKIAMAAGVPPLVWAMVVSFGAATLLLPMLIVRRQLALPRGQMLRYTVISGLVSFAAINAMMFFLIPLVGAGYTSLMFALSPVTTLALTALAGLKVPGRLGLIGIGFGLVGAVVVALTRGAGGTPDMALWSLLAFAIPATLAIGNVYRTLDWPEGAHPMALAFWSHGVALLAFIILQLAVSGRIPLGTLGHVPMITVAQLITAGLTFPAYFALQRAGGPVLLSQIGYVAAAVGLASGTLFLGEVYSPLTWTGATIFAAGIALSITAQLAPAMPDPVRA